jgi:hypothetical protein
METLKTEAEAKAALAELSRFYGEPVRPVSEYCAALRTWGDLAAEKEIISHDALQSISLGVGKSNLLARLIYGGETLRVRECPEHKGHWTGLEWEMRDGSTNRCVHGCGLTGWIPNDAPEVKP